jgi:hypothetical protein
VYQFNSSNKLELSISIHSFKGTAEEIALVDSGAMENFIDQKLVDKLKLGTRRLKQPIKLRNINGTFNQTGQITHYLDLLTARGNKKIKERFYVTGLSGVELILGYPWLRDFNPQIDWATNKLLGLEVRLSTLLHARYPHLRSSLKNKGTRINHEELIVQRAEPVPTKTQPPLELPKEPTAAEQVPERCHEYLDIFTKPIARQLPPHREWDLKVRLLPNAPALISCIPYQLSRAEQEFQSQYIKENLA